MTVTNDIYLPSTLFQKGYNLSIYMHIYITTDVFPHVLEVIMFCRESSVNKRRNGVKCAFRQGVLEERSAWAKSNVKTRPNTHHIVKEDNEDNTTGFDWGWAATPWRAHASGVRPRQPQVGSRPIFFQINQKIM